MQDRPFAFVCSPFRGDLEANAEKARQYSRQMYDAGYTPLTPHLLFPQFLSEHNPTEREAGIQMGMVLAGCKLLVVCGDAVTEGMAREISQAERLGIEVRPLDRLDRNNTKPSLLAALRSPQTEQTARDNPAKSRQPEL